MILTNSHRFIPQQLPQKQQTNQNDSKKFTICFIPQQLPTETAKPTKMIPTSSQSPKISSHNHPWKITKTISDFISQPSLSKNLKKTPRTLKEKILVDLLWERGKKVLFCWREDRLKNQIGLSFLSNCCERKGRKFLFCCVLKFAQKSKTEERKLRSMKVANWLWKKIISFSLINYTLITK